MDDVFLSPYNHKDHEKNVYKEWEQHRLFNPDILEDNEEPFSILMPPPNANGSLHAGHALFVTLQDIIIRFHRMCGKKTVWIPGADHAGFETQVVYEKKLAKEKRSRFDLTRDELYKEIWEFTQENKVYMENQIRSLGASCDWSRSYFTLDETIQKEVGKTFKAMHDDELLYRGLRSVPWCPKHQTGFSELELEYVERKDPFYYFQYGPFVIGTVRPETKFADKYVVVHPDDERYAEYAHGQEIEIEWISGTITATVIKDEAGNPEQGSGAMTITPWHSAIDYDIAQRHNLSFEQIIDERGKLLPIAGEFAGMPITEAREKIVAKLQAKSLVVDIDTEYTHSVPVCYKCERDIEPQLKQQWFVKTDMVTKKAIDAIQSGDIEFVAEKNGKNNALQRLKNMKDWNISRQIVWGIPIPAKICEGCSEGFVDLEDTIQTCPSCDGKVSPDSDVFDTWFSSAQLPFLSLGYPKGKDYTTFYPTQVMETGYDILFAWVVRMMLLGLYRTGEVPFKKIYLHGLVTDAKGKKMSKSKGNGLDPLEVLEEYGTDALRMSYVVGNPPGQNTPFSLDKVRAYKKFANKLWNIARFVLVEVKELKDISPAILIEEDKKILESFKILREEITHDMEAYRFHLASEKIYQYTWHVFADVILEQSKDVIQHNSKNIVDSRKALLVLLLTQILKTLHPFMPFITEVIWKHIPDNEYKTKEHLIIERW